MPLHTAYPRRLRRFAGRASPRERHFLLRRRMWGPIPNSSAPIVIFIVISLGKQGTVSPLRRKTANAVALRLLSFLSGFVVNCLLYQLSIHNTTHCWCILLTVVCNLTAAFCFNEGALYRARPDLAKVWRCALLPSIAETDFGFPSYGTARWRISK